MSQFGGDDFKLHADLSVSLGDSLKALEGFENKIAQTAEATQAAIGKISASLNALNRRAKLADPAGAREAGNAAAKLAPELIHAAQQANALERSLASLFATSARATPALTAIAGSMASIAASSAQAAAQSTTAIRLIGSAAAASAGPVKALADGQKQLSEKTAAAAIEASRLRLANLAAAVSAETSQLATRKAADALDRAAAFSTRAADGLRQFGSRLSLVATLVSTGFATASFREFEHLDEALVALRSTLGQTEKEFASTRIAVVDLAQGTEFSATKVADSVRRFVAAQNSLPDSLRLTEVAARGAVASQTDLVTSTEALSTALRSFRIPADEAERTMAQLSIASEQSRVGFAQFSQALSAVAPAAASAGGDLAGTLAVLRDMIQETGDASEATTKFRSVLQELIGVDPLSKQGERLREVLGSTVEASFATRGLVETIKLIVNAAEGSTTKLQELVGAGRTLVAFTRLQRLGVDELDKSYKRFSEITAANLTEEYETQKDAVSELVKETKALVSNTLAASFDRIASAVSGSLKSINEFIKANRDFISVVGAMALVLSSAVVGINLLRGASVLLAGAVGALARAFRIGAAAALVFEGVVTGTYAAALGALIPKVEKAAAALKGFAAINIGASFASAGQSAAAVGTTIEGIGSASVAASTKVTRLLAIIGRAGVIAVAVTAVAYAFYSIGRAADTSGNAVDAAERSLASYNAEQRKLAAQTKIAEADTTALNAVLARQAELVAELNRLRGQEAVTPERDQGGIRQQIKAVESELSQLQQTQTSAVASVGSAIDAINARILAGQQNLVDEQEKIVERNRGIAAGLAQGAVVPKSDTPELIKQRRILDEIKAGTADRVDVTLALTNALIAEGESEKTAAASALNYLKRLDDLKAAAEASAVDTDDLTRAESNLSVETTRGAAAIEKLADSVAEPATDRFEAELGKVAETADKVQVQIDRLRASIAAYKLAATAAGQSPLPGATAKAEDQIKKLEDALSRLARGAKLIRDEQAKDRARETDETLASIEQIKIETLRAIGDTDRADELAARLKLRRALEQANALRSSTLPNKDSLAKELEDAARRAYDAELGAIRRNKAEREKSSAIAQALQHKEEENLRKAALLEEARALKDRADAARKAGDLRTEAALRDRISSLIQESGDRAEDLLNKQRGLVQSAKDQLSLTKAEVESRLRIGEGAAGIVTGTQGGLSRVAGASSAPEFRSAVRDRLAGAQDVAGAQSLFKVIRELLEAEFAGREQRIAEAARIADPEERKRVIDEQIKGEKDIAERYRILKDELDRAVKEIGAQPGGRPSQTPESPITIPGSQVRPDENVPPGVKVLGPPTKDKELIDAIKAQGDGFKEIFDNPVKIVAPQPIPVSIVGPGVPSSVAKSATNEPEISNAKESGGSDKVSSILSAIVTAALAAGVSPVGPPAPAERASSITFAPPNLVGPPAPGTIQSGPVIVPESASKSIRKATAPFGPPTSAITQSILTPEELGIDPNAPPVAPTAPAPASSPESPIGQAVSQSLSSIASASEGLIAVADDLLAAITSNGAATVTAISTIGDKLSSAVDQLNTNTAAIVAVERNVLGLRIEGRE